MLRLRLVVTMYDNFGRNSLILWSQYDPFNARLISWHTLSLLHSLHLCLSDMKKVVFHLLLACASLGFLYPTVNFYYSNTKKIPRLQLLISCINKIEMNLLLSKKKKNQWFFLRKETSCPSSSLVHPLMMFVSTFKCLLKTQFVHNLLAYSVTGTIKALTFLPWPQLTCSLKHVSFESTERLLRITNKWFFFSAMLHNFIVYP